MNGLGKSLTFIASLTTPSLLSLADAKEIMGNVSAMDARIDSEAESTLLLDGRLNIFDIYTEVTDGKVILTGSVDTEVHKALATELVKSLTGVIAVENRLAVVTPNDNDSTGSTFAKDLQEAKVVTAVKSRLLLESTITGVDIDVQFQQGIVTLYGKVKSYRERDLAIAIAKNTDDVDDVISELSVDS
ncbi:BON domain-containing protein [Alteromonas ponticola]|uniref:BON domain-containing protein n=1 Tax=Alteromonas aquimaris TaxID=2998417 RepID=A0ABT3P8M5_9ALTE|nr:BON domain-containing protein [Alteromonas aquimaris]MCW8109131.1 BON domain-containing protein [Alteromonas aquimaris]